MAGCSYRVPHQTTLHLVNNFVLQTTRFLNRFSLTCEEKLAEVSSGIQSLEISLSIIEAKLKIKGLEAAPATAPAPAPAAAPVQAAAPLQAPVRRLSLKRLHRQWQSQSRSRYNPPV